MIFSQAQARPSSGVQSPGTAQAPAPAPAQGKIAAPDQQGDTFIDKLG